MDIVDESERTEEQKYHDWVHAENTAIEEEIFVRNMEKLAAKVNEINARYDNEPRPKNSRKTWTSKQRHRVQKQKAKWHRRLLGKF